MATELIREPSGRSLGLNPVIFTHPRPPRAATQIPKHHTEASVLVIETSLSGRQKKKKLDDEYIVPVYGLKYALTELGKQMYI